MSTLFIYLYTFADTLLKLFENQIVSFHDKTNVLLIICRYLYPYFVEMSWFVIEKYHKYLKYAEDHGKGLVDVFSEFM